MAVLVWRASRANKQALSDSLSLFIAPPTSPFSFAVLSGAPFCLPALDAHPTGVVIGLGNQLIPIPE